MNKVAVLPGKIHQSSQDLRRSREDHRVQRSRSLGPYQASEGTSDLSGLGAGRFEVDDDANPVMRRGRAGRIQDGRVSAGFHLC